MTDKNYTHVILVVDKSGSMQTMRSDAEHSINNFMKDQAEGVGEITVSLYEFNNYTRRVFGPIDAKEAPYYFLVPTGGTALRDAMDLAIDETGKFLRSLEEDNRPGKVIFVTITDGEENASRNCSQQQLKTKIVEQESKYNWEFVFLAANIDAFATSLSYGINTTMQYANTGTSYTMAYNNLSTSLLNARATGATVKSMLATDIDENGNEIK